MKTINPKDYTSQDEYYEAIGEQEIQKTKLLNNLNWIIEDPKLYLSTDVGMWADVINDSLGKDNFIKHLNNKTTPDFIAELRHAYEISKALTKSLEKELAVYE